MLYTHKVLGLLSSTAKKAKGEKVKTVERVAGEGVLKRRVVKVKSHCSYR